MLTTLINAYRGLVALRRALVAIAVSLVTVFLIAALPAHADSCGAAAAPSRAGAATDVASNSAAGEAGGTFVADSFSFGVEREAKESGEKGGTEDINIGVGELQECTISKSMD